MKRPGHKFERKSPFDFLRKDKSDSEEKTARAKISESESLIRNIRSLEDGTNHNFSENSNNFLAHETDETPTDVSPPVEIEDIETRINNCIKPLLANAGECEGATSHTGSLCRAWRYMRDCPFEIN